MRMFSPSHRFVAALTGTLLTLSSCGLFDGGGGGGGGGGGTFSFTQGFTFVRKDDRNVYLADDADTQTTSTLTQSANVRTPSFSADGKTVVFVRGAGADAELAVVPTAGGTVRTVLASTTMMRNFKTPVFSPDGATIAFGFDDGTAATRVALVNVDGTNVRTLPSGGLAQASPSFTPDGASLIVAAGAAGLGYTQIEQITLATGQVTNVTNTLGSEALSIANRLVVSPDGTTVAFDGEVSSGVTRVFVMGLSTKTVVMAYAGEAGANDTFPCWMSATQLAFSSDSGLNDNVYRVVLGGTSATLLVPKAIEPWYGAVKL